VTASTSSSPTSTSAPASATTAPLLPQLLPAATSPASSLTASSASPLPTHTTLVLPPLPRGRKKGSKNGVVARPDFRRQRHKQTEDARRRRMNVTLEELRQLLGLDARTDKITLLQCVREALSGPVVPRPVQKARPLTTLNLPSMPNAAIMAIDCANTSIIDLNGEAQRHLKITPAMLPVSVKHHRVLGDAPFFLPWILRLTLGLRQSLTVLKRYRDVDGKIHWGRFTLNRVARNGKIFGLAVGEFYEDLPPLDVPYAF
jgi:hypothetical protein